MHGSTGHSLVPSGKKKKIKVRKGENLSVSDHIVFAQNDIALPLPKNLLLVESN